MSNVRSGLSLPGRLQVCKAYLAQHYRWYVLALLWLVAVLRFVDLQILAVLLEPIKAEFLLTDTQLALLGGLAFALFYGLLGLPVAWLADRFDRRLIIALSVGLWSLMTAACGFAGSFLTLFLARMGVGVGEAGAYPPSTSLLADYFLPQQRGRVYAILASAIPAGVFVGFVIGGIVSQYWGWRAAMQVVGLPGVLLGVVVFFTLREPERGRLDARSDSKAQAPPFFECVSGLWKIPAYRHVVLGACLYTLGAYGSGVWLPSFFIRHHGFSIADIGLWMAFIYGGGGLCGALAGGWLAEWLGKRRGGEWHARLCSTSLLATLPLVPLVYLMQNPWLALTIQGLIVVLMHINVGPVLTQIQAIAGPDRRAVAHAFSVLLSNLVALPLGPLFVGMFSDRFTALAGTQALGFGIAILLLLAWSWAAWHFWRAAVPYRQAVPLLAP